MINLLALTTPTTQTWVTLGVVAGIFAGSALLIGALILVIGKVFKEIGRASCRERVSA